MAPPGKYYDARSWLMLDNAASSRNVHLRANNQRDYRAFERLARTGPEIAVSTRVCSKLFGAGESRFERKAMPSAEGNQGPGQNPVGGPGHDQYRRDRRGHRVASDISGQRRCRSGCA